MQKRALAASILFGLRGNAEDECALFRYAFWIQAIMVFIVMLFASVYSGRLRWDEEPVLAFLFLFFGIYGYGVPLFRQRLEAAGNPVGVGGQPSEDRCQKAEGFNHSW